MSLEKLFQINPEIAAQIAAEKDSMTLPEGCDASSVHGIIAQSKAAQDEMLDVIEAQHGRHFRMVVELFVNLMSMHSLVVGGAIAARPAGPARDIVIEGSRTLMTRTVESVGKALVPELDEVGGDVVAWAEKVYAIHEQGVKRVGNAAMKPQA
jgi:hypothetical protein